MAYTYKYPRPEVTVDIAVFARKSRRWHVLLIQRKHDPFEGMWALPGGFVDEDEDLPDAAARELQEETCATGFELVQCGAYGKPGRDPRAHTVTVAYYTKLDAIPEGVQAADDAAEADWFPINGLPPMAFDHAQILADCRKRAFRR